MKVLTWAEQDGIIIREDVKEKLSTKPALSFEFDSIYFEPNHQFKVLGGVNTDLTEDEIAEVDHYIINATITPMNLCVDAQGVFKGFSVVGPTDTIVTYGPPNGDNYRYDFDLGDYVYIMAVDDNGVYLGNVPVGSYAAEVPEPPVHIFDRWDFATNSWYDARTLDDYKLAKVEIAELECGNVRKKYITTNDGMSGVYVYKSNQARLYTEDPAPVESDYPLLAAEVVAMKVSNPAATMADAATFIITTEAVWVDILAKIESARRVFKAKTASAVDRETVDAAMHEMRQALELI